MFAFLVAIVVAVGLRLLLYRTRAGVTMRATVDDRPLATLNGGRPDRSALLAWAIGCSLAALAGILAAPDQALSPVLTLLIVNAYAAAVIGRLRSLPLTFLGAVILGLADAYGTGYITCSNDYLSGFRAAIPVIILFVALLVLPQSGCAGTARRAPANGMPDADVARLARRLRRRCSSRPRSSPRGHRRQRAHAACESSASASSPCRWCRSSATRARSRCAR